MSEFKYACPVCGQHMMCDASQAGTVMDCPTCFQKIVAPQAPAPDSKFILTGTKLSEKKVFVPGENNPVIVKKSFPIALVVTLALACAALAAGIFYKTKSSKPAGKGPVPAKAPGVAQKMASARPPKPVVAAPPANDANWSLNLGTNPIPDTPVAGRIHGRDFLIEHANFSTNGTLSLRSGLRGPIEFGALINFAGAGAESLAGQTINVLPDADVAARVQLRWKEEGSKMQRADYPNGYAMRLEFGPLANNHLPGKIYLCTPDAEKSYLLGAFTAEARRPHPRPPK